MYKSIAKLVGNTERTIFAWKKENRPIITLVQKYFTKKDLEEFLETGVIAKMEYLNNYELKQNSEFNKLYVTKFSRTDNSFYKRIFWDFIHTEYSNLIDLEYDNCKSSFQKYLLQYHYKLIEQNKNEFDSIVISSKMCSFIEIFQNISEDLTYFIIKNTKSGFQEHINYLLESKFFLGAYAAEIYSCYHLHDSSYNPFLNTLLGEKFINNLYKKKIIEYKNSYSNIKESNAIYILVKDYLENIDNRENEIKKILH